MSTVGQHNSQVFQMKHINDCASIFCFRQPPSTQTTLLNYERFQIRKWVHLATPYEISSALFFSPVYLYFMGYPKHNGTCGIWLTIAIKNWRSCCCPGGCKLKWNFPVCLSSLICWRGNLKTHNSLLALLSFDLVSFE